MPTPDIFRSNLFSLTSLTASINNLPYQPTRIADLGIFEEEGIPTLDVWIESDNGVLSLLDVKARGAPSAPVTTGKREGRSFRCPHIPVEGQVLADEVNFVREFGSETAQRTIQSVIDKKQAIARRNIDYTIESHRLSALMGNYIDANNVPKSLFAEFTVSQQEVAMDLSTVGTDQESKHLQVMEAIEDALGGLPFTDVMVLAGKNYWKDYIANKSIKETYLNTAQSAELRADPRNPRNFGGMTTERYRGSSLVKIPDDEAYAIPIGVPGLFLTRFAPGTNLEAVGSLGIPYYSVPETLDFSEGIKFKAQSNPLNICTRPRAIIKLKKGAT